MLDGNRGAGKIRSRLTVQYTCIKILKYKKEFVKYSYQCKFLPQ